MSWIRCHRVFWGLSAAAIIFVAACSDAGGPLPACSVASGAPVRLAVGQWVSFDAATAGGCFSFPANPSSIDSAEYLLLPQSAAPIPVDSASFVLQAGSIAALLLPPVPTNAAAFDAHLREMGRTGAFPAAARQGASLRAMASAQSPPGLGDERSFVVCANLACTVTDTVGAKVQSVGAHVAIYVDTVNPAGTPTAGLSTADLDTLIQVFDSRLYPLATSNFGPASDIDGNGVVIALMTPTVNSLVTPAQCTQGGFIAGFFFEGDLYPGITAYNRGEIYYSIVPDPNSVVSCAHTSAQVKRLAGGTFIHEFQHMINFGQHVLQRGAAPEEGWLDEGLSKYAEELAARTYLPGDSATFHQYTTFGLLYNAYQYLNAPDGAFLEIPYDQGTLAEVGASWLFVRYLMDQYGPTLAGGLVQSPFHGSQNVLARTGAASFSTLVSQWGLANWVSDLPGFSPPPELRYTSWSLRATFDTLHSENPTRFPLDYPLIPVTAAGSAVDMTGWLRSGSGMYGRALQGPGAPGFALRFSANGSQALTAVVLPRLTIERIR